MLKEWIFIAAILVSYGHSQEMQCPQGCTCKSSSQDMVTMSCKSLSFNKNNPSASELITNFEIFQSEKPLHMIENVFSGVGLQKVNTITISNSSVISIEKDAFKELAELNTIRIMHTNVSYIHPDTFKQNTKLGKLYLHNNPLTQMESIDSPSLQELIISYCSLNEIKANMFNKLVNLEMVDLRGNNIKEIAPGTFDSLSDVTEIHLEDNQISHLTEDIFDKTISLENLYLDNNPIVTISNLKAPDLITLSLRSCKIKSLKADSFNGLESLTSLDLSNNQMTQIGSKALYKLTSLITINLSGNDLLGMDEQVFYYNSNLEKVILDNNKNMKHLPAHGFKHNNALPWFNVYSFSCQNCGLTALSENTFSTMPLIVTLNLSHNKISDVRTGVFANLKSLQELDLSHNEIVTMDDETFRTNTDLHALNLAGNMLKTLHPSIFKHNTKLQNLDLHSCGLPSLWTGLKVERLASIQNLNISDNKITLIKTEDVAVTSNLKSIDLSGNELSCTDSYRDLIEYLTDKGIQDTEYRTHEEMTDSESDESELDEPIKSDASMGIWKEHARIVCPDIIFTTKDIDDNIPATTEEYVDIDYAGKSTSAKVVEDQYNEDDDDEDEDEDEDDDEEAEDAEGIDDELIKLPGESDIAMHVRTRYERYSYLWLTLIFLAVLLVTLGVVANLILFIIRRRQMIEVPRINIRHISKLKKNSGLVYQQLSEERDGAKTPVLSRFIPIPSVHTPNAPNPNFV